MSDATLDPRALKPCPFCGWDTPHVSYDHNGCAWVSCDKCLARSGGFQEPDWPDERLKCEAISEWNRRAALSQPQAGEPVAVERVEMVDWSSGYEQPADPIWRIVVNGYCADFPTETGAQNFASAIMLYASPQPALAVKGLEWEPSGMAWVASTSIGGYEVHKFAVDGLSTRLKTAHDIVATWFASEEPAKAAAQADYETRIRSALVSPPPSGEVEAQIKHMVERFLSWKLPKDFNPDGGISFKREFNEHTPPPMIHQPYGTNLFDFGQAKAMVSHMLEGLPAHAAVMRAGRQEVANIVPEGCTGKALAFDPGALHVNKDGSGYFVVDEGEWTLEDDRCEGPDGPQGSVHWIARLDASEMQALRDFLNGSALSSALATADGWRTMAVEAAVQEYGLVDSLAGKAEIAGRHAAVRGMMVRLGLYDHFCALLNDDPLPAAPTATGGREP